MTIESYFEDIADAIRERGGTSAALTPAAMPQAILDIPGGGGGDDLLIAPSYAGLSYSYISGSNFEGYTSKTNYIYLYETTSTTDYILLLKNDTRGNRFRSAFFANKSLSDFLPGINNPSAARITGVSISNVASNTPQAYLYTPSNSLAGVVVLMVSSDSTTANAYCFDGSAIDGRSPT